MLPTTTLGRTGLEVTRLGYGSMGLRGPRTWGVRVVNETEAETILNAVLDSGINFIDTAPDYGISEARIGRFLSHRREEFFLATKCGCAPIQQDDHLEIAHQWNRETVLRNVDESLSRLRTDYLDLLQFHGGSVAELAQDQLIELLLDLRSQGVVRHIGSSQKMPAIAPLVELGVLETFQVPFSCLAPEHAPIIQRAGELGAGVIVRGGIAHGGPQAEIQRPLLNNIWEQARLQDILPPEMAPAELILRYTLSQPHCHTVIVGTCNREHLQANVDAAKRGPLPDPLLQEIRQRVQRAVDLQEN